ncbi:GPW/gp25 family protein [Desulfovibrio ferrophilus]|uniref:Phage-related baseplate assembly protein n=1 Tax=Desulfovibrio ferrophilus TaxID=241368 RepID=A0A2Z6AYV5_9BACT|nr:GPW/gp25 family protein [Desulfovibrio ferrophilus]BBD08451.1 phage-related baseplate assembly protein [Desulfovibrio ferrophilus]
MRGMCAASGKSLDGIAHLRQSIRDILTTPLGSRVHRRDYGSRLPRLVDAPLNDGTLIELYAATAEAIAKWEPRFGLSSVKAERGEAGRVVLALTGTYLPEGKAVTLEGIIL